MNISGSDSWSLGVGVVSEQQCDLWRRLWLPYSSFHGINSHVTHVSDPTSTPYWGFPNHPIHTHSDILQTFTQALTDNFLVEHKLPEQRNFVLIITGSPAPRKLSARSWHSL